MAQTIVKPRKGVFVIMPFTDTPTRNTAQLSSFFNNNLKAPIEAAPNLANSYFAWRSGEKFDINGQIIRDLVSAEIVIADLSGIEPNPNVMYELGVRLAATHRPVILIREDHPENRRIFDIFGFYTHLYDPLDYPKLERHLLEKLGRYESGEDVSESPVLRIIGGDVSIQSRTDRDLSPEQQREFVLRGATQSVQLMAKAFGPRGGKIAIARAKSFQLVTKNAREIISGMRSIEPLEAEGMDVIAQLVRDMDEVGGGAKTAALIGGALLEAAEGALRDGHDAREVAEGMRRAKDAAVAFLSDQTIDCEDEMVLPVVATATQDGLIAQAIVEAAQIADGIDFVTIESGGERRAEVFRATGHSFPAVLASRRFVNDTDTGAARFSECWVLVTNEKVQSMKDLLPLLEEAARAKKPLVIFAESVEGDALATLIVNHQSGVISAAVARVIGSPAIRLAVLEDIAALTGAKFISPEFGGRIDQVTIADLGEAGTVAVGDAETIILDPSGEAKHLSSRMTEIRLGLHFAKSDLDRERLLSRLAGLTGKSATIVAGGETENDVRDARYRIESGAHALSRSRQTGILPGGGVALVNASRAVDSMVVSNQAQAAGRRAMSQALVAPLRQLAVSAGLRIDDIEGQPSTLGKNAGIDVNRREVVPDIVVAGIVDPAAMLIRAVTLAHSRINDLLETSVWTTSALKPLLDENGQ